jgi:lactoylglutathione lyase
MIRKLEHVGILAEDLDRSIRFYTELLGLKLVERVRFNEKVELAFLSFPGQEDVQVELIGRDPAGMPQEGLVNHLAFTVDDIEAVIEKLRSHGVDISEEWPRTILDGRKNAFFYGPSGEKLELFQPVRKG